MKLEQAIRESYLVRGLSEEEIESIVKIAQQKTFTDGQTLMRAGEIGHELAIILVGAARIVTPTGDRLADVGPGRVVGEISLLDEAPRSATIVSAGTTTVASIPFDRLRELMQAHPSIELGILRNLSKVLCEHIRKDNVHLERYYFLLG